MQFYGFADKLLKNVYSMGIISLWKESKIDYVEHQEEGIVIMEHQVVENLKKAFESVDFQGKNALDVGCGGGVLTNILVEKGAETYGLDIALSSVQHALKKNNKVNGLQASAEEIPFKDGSLDFISSTDVIEHVINPMNVVDEISRKIRSGGTVVICLPTSYSTKNLLMDLIFPTIKGLVFKIIGKQAPKPSRGHQHIFSDENFRKIMEERGFQIEKTIKFNMPDISRNRWLIKPASWITGLLIPKSRYDQEIFILKKIF